MTKYSIIITQSVLREVHSSCKSEFSTQSDLVLPLSSSIILPFPSGHPVAAYVFFFVFLSYLSLNKVF
jgi:hypothetical protein